MDIAELERSLSEKIAQVDQTQRLLISGLNQMVRTEAVQTDLLRQIITILTPPTDDEPSPLVDTLRDLVLGYRDIRASQEHVEARLDPTADAIERIEPQVEQIAARLVATH